MIPLPSPTVEVDTQEIAAALNRKFKSQAILAAVKFDSKLEIWLSGLSVPHPEQTTKVVVQVLGELQLNAQTVKVFGQRTDATVPEWERNVEIQPIHRFEANRGRDLAPKIDRHQPARAACPENHLVLAILATFLGVLPLGVVAISYASQVNSKYAAGDDLGATAYAKNAKRLSIISLSISGATTAIIFFSLILPLFLSGGYITKIKQEKAANKYIKTVLKAKLDELVTANVNNNRMGISATLNSPPPTDINYTFTGELVYDPISQRNNFKLLATPTSNKLHSFVGFAYTVEQGNSWVAKTDGCVSKDTSFYPPDATISNGTITCDANSKLASEADN